MESDIFMWIPSPIAEILCERDDSFKPFMHNNGNILVQLMKAQYGCIESARLWYNHLSQTLTEQGFSKKPQDQCIFQRDEGNNEWIYITVYVDDKNDCERQKGMLTQSLRKSKKNTWILQSNVEKYTITLECDSTSPIKTFYINVNLFK